MQNELVIRSLKSKNYYRLLSQIYRDVAKSSTLKEALTILVNVTTVVIGCERGSVFLNDEKTGELYSFIAQGDLQHEIRLLNNSGLVGWSFTHDESIIVPDAYNDPRYNKIIDQITGFRTRSVLCVPLKSVNNELIGVTQMLNKTDDNFTETDIQIVKALTEHAALAIQSKLTIEHIEAAHKKELEFLEAITRVSAEIQLTTLLEKIINTITKALDAERATLFINDFKTNELYTEASVGLENKKEIRFPNTIGIAGSVFTTGEVVNIPHAYADLRFNPSFDKTTGFFTRSILTAPVRNKAGVVIGVTQVLNKRHGEFNNDDASQLIAINTQISMAIENAKLFDDVQNIKNYNESILESMTNSVITINESNKIVTCNKAGLKLFGLAANELINKDATEFFKNINKILIEKINMVTNSKGASKQEVLMDAELAIGEKTITANVTVVPLLSAKAARLGVMLMIEDISSEKRMKSTMSRYMSPDLADQLLKSSDFSLGGTSTVATILFSDIRNFTTITESIGPEETVKMLNEYFTLMVDCIQNEGGMLDKFIGDAIMAVFGNPFPHDDDPDRALRSAISMMRELQNFNKKRIARHLEPIDHGIGINTDEVVSGNIGSEKRMDFTVIGDGVNLASRLESLCKEYGAHLLITEFTFNLLKSTYRTRQLDKVVVKGKAKPVRIYEVIDFYDSESFPHQIEVLNHFSNGIEFYNKCEWDNAISSFESALKLYENDKPSRMYLERCKTLKENPPGADWDGVWVMKHK